MRSGFRILSFCSEARKTPVRLELESLEARLVPSANFASTELASTQPPTSIVTNLGNAPEQIISTIPPNGDVNPYGVAFVPKNVHGGKLAPGDVLVSNFNDNANVQATGTTIVKIAPDGQQSLFFQGPQGLGLTTALGVLPRGFVIVGNAPAATTTDGTPTVGAGSLLILDSNGNQVGQISDPNLLQGPWDLTVNTLNNSHAQVFVANALSGTVTRIDLRIPPHGTPMVQSETQIASGYVHRTDPAALVVGPTGLAYDPKSDTLYVASTGDNAIYAISNASKTRLDNGVGRVAVTDSVHLHGPLGLLLAPNGDLIAANGDAVNTDPNHPNELVEYTPSGQFVGQFQVDPGAPGGAFGLAVQSVGNRIRFAAVDDDANTLDIWTLGSAHGGQKHAALDALFGKM